MQKACYDFYVKTQVKQGFNIYSRKRKIYRKRDTDLNDISVVDSIMGSGKTSWAIKYMNDHKDQRFMYVTPYKEEITRVLKQCRRFKQPTDEDGHHVTKRQDFEDLLSCGTSIATTHELFKRCNPVRKVLESITNYDYTLILDEAINVIEKTQITKHDFDTLFDRFVEADKETGLIKWTENTYKGVNKDYKRLINSKTVFRYGENLLLWLFPIEMLSVFKRVFILTFMFKGSPFEQYLKVNGMGFKQYYTRCANTLNGNNKAFELIEGEQNTIPIKTDIAKKIEIYSGDLNKIGKYSGSLNWRWWDESNSKKRKIIMANAETYFEEVCEASDEQIMWTCIKYKPRNKKPTINRKYGSCFCACNARATNKYSQCDCLAYLADININPTIKAWFTDHKGKVDEEQYSLSQLLQWIWRSAIRDDKPIRLYLPSQRMRNLLTDWLGIERIP